MIDTVKLLLHKGQYQLIRRGELHFSSTERGVKRYIRNPSSIELKAGVYLPKLTFIQRPSPLGIQETLAVEFSAPKLVYGNNFNELTDDDFTIVITNLEAALKTMGVNVSSESLIDAKVVAWHPSKNILFNEYFATQTVINTLRKADVSRTYTDMKTDFSDGEAMHYHCNSKDIVVYDKLADLLHSKVSDKRAKESHSQIQHSLLDVLTAVERLSILRFELRFNGAAAVRRAVKPVLGTISPTFEQVFSSQLSRAVLIQHWHQLTTDVNYLGLDTGKPLDVLQNYLTEHDDMTPMSALAAVAALLVANQDGVRALRQTLDTRFGKHFWSRIKGLMQSPQPHQLKHFTHVEQVLGEFESVNISSLKALKSY